MEKNLQHITTLLYDIKSDGTFVVSGAERLIIPGLRIEKFGEVNFPIETHQVQSIIGISQKAPFGKGSKTIYNDFVRNVWEIDFKNDAFRTPRVNLIFESISLLSDNL